MSSIKPTRDQALYSKTDPALMTDGLFVPRPSRKRAIDIQRKWGDGEIGFRGVQLGAAHESLLLAICARAGMDGEQIKGEESGGELWDKLTVTGEARSATTAEIEVSAYQLLEDIGYKQRGGAAFRMIDRLLRDLATLTVWRRIGGSSGASHVLSYTRTDDRLKIRLSWRIAGAIFGLVPQHARVSIEERRELSSTAKRLHAWLSAHVRPGQSLAAGQAVDPDCLIVHIWGEMPPRSNRRLLSKRRAATRDAIEEIAALPGWSVTWSGRRVRIARPVDTA